MRLDENAVAIVAGNDIVLDDIVTRAILQKDAARVATAPDRFVVAPGARAHVIARRVADDFAVGRVDKTDAPRRIAIGGVALDRDVIAVADVEADGLIVRLIVLDARVLHAVKANAARFAGSEENSIALGIRVVVIPGEIVVVDVHVDSRRRHNGGAEVGQLAVFDFDVGRRFEQRKIEFANNDTVAREISSRGGVIVAVEHDVVALDDKAFEPLGVDVACDFVIARLENLRAITDR